MSPYLRLPVMCFCIALTAQLLREPGCPPLKIENENVDGHAKRRGCGRTAPRVRSFAERALKEILLGEGESSLLSDKNAFSEFMYKVTERYVLVSVMTPVMYQGCLWGNRPYIEVGLHFPLVF